MNDIHSPPDPYKENFDLPPGGFQFVDVLAQDPNLKTPHLLVLHTVHAITLCVPKQEYKLTISAVGDNAKGDSKNFELIREGDYWEMKQR